MLRGEPGIEYLLNECPLWIGKFAGDLRYTVDNTASAEQVLFSHFREETEVYRD